MRRTTGWRSNVVRASALALLAAALGHGRAAAQADEAPSPSQARAFALLVQGGVFSAFGGGVAVGSPGAGLRATVGWAPTLMTLDRAGETSLHVYSGLELAPDLYVRLLHPRPGTHFGLQGGYRYSTLYGHGGALGAYVQFRVSTALDLLVAGGVHVYPDGPGRLRREQGLPAGTDFGFPGPAVHLGASVGLVIFP